MIDQNQIPREFTISLIDKFIRLLNRVVLIKIILVTTWTENLIRILNKTLLTMIIAQHFVIIISIGVNFVFILLDGIFNDGCSPRFNVVGSRLQIIGGTLLKCTRESSCSMSTRSTCLVFPVLEYCPWMIMDTARCENSRIFLTRNFTWNRIGTYGKW